MACVCGHSIEEHYNEKGACQAYVEFNGREEPCNCVLYELGDELGDEV